MARGTDKKNNSKKQQQKNPQKQQKKQNNDGYCSKDKTNVMDMGALANVLLRKVGVMANKTANKLAEDASVANISQGEELCMSFGRNQKIVK